jgi:hypothetical protein
MGGRLGVHRVDFADLPRENFVLAVPAAFGIVLPME